MYACWFCVRLPCRVGVCELRPDVDFVHQGNIFFGLSEYCVSECLEDTEAGFKFSVYVICVS